MKSETVLVLQGGGSLGAYECGVYKTLVRHGIKFDTIAGTSIGAVNASIISSMQRSGNNNNNNAADTLERFWITLAENVIPPISSLFLPDKARSVLSSIYSTVYGNSRHLCQDGLCHQLPQIIYYHIIGHISMIALL